MEKSRIPFIKYMPGITWFFIICILTLMPASDVPQVGWLNNIPNFDKLVHAGLFGGLTFLFCWPYFKPDISFKKKINYFITIAMAACLWGLAIEFIQKLFVSSRDFDLLDWAADSIGVLIAFWLCKRIVKYFENTKAI